MRLAHLTVLGVVLFSMISGSGAATLEVDQSNPSCDDGDCDPCCCTIQGAVFQSVHDDVISVAPGTYPEQIDFRDMWVIGDITLEAASGPGTVLVSPPSGHTVRHGDGHINTVTIDGIDVSSASGSACVYLDHAGNVILYDVTANNCGYTAFVLDNTGSVNMYRCTANSSAGNGIQIEGASGAYLEDCQTNSNLNGDGVSISSVPYTTHLVDPTAVGNGGDGLDLDVQWFVIQGGTVTDNGGRGIDAIVTDSSLIENMTVLGNGEYGIDIDWNGVDPVEGLTLFGLTVSNNGHTGNDHGARLRNITGTVAVTDCVFDDNALDGFSPETSVIGDLEITGGHADRNGEDGYDLRIVGNVTISGAAAVGNQEKGIAVDSQGTVVIEDCVASDNENNAGIAVNWQDPETVDSVSVTGCTANNNGLSGGGNGIYIQHVVGPVTVAETTTNGNSRTGVRVDSTVGPVLIRDAVSNFGIEEGIKIDIDDGPLTVKDCLTDGNALEGLKIHPEDTGIESMTVTRNTVVNNLGTGVAIYDFAAPVDFELRCNDIAGNVNGLYLEAQVSVDARHIWWGDPTGPSGPGTTGAGDTVYAESGATILYDPWLVESFTAPVSGCPFFTADFEIGTTSEWGAVSP
ncbi:MAG: right-handed parallel beta-helix repeat-containing protein [Thermoanaerobaculales bacterium]|jgi:hypothetical protein|nr:right-handed parallel beta-helix repeat-containing protein [Thermoanaerobaculales bacterium]